MVDNRELLKENERLKEILKEELLESQYNGLCK
jgi:hypothetical protein